MIKYLAQIKAFLLSHRFYTISGIAVILIGGGLVFHFAGFTMDIPPVWLALTIR